MLFIISTVFLITKQKDNLDVKKIRFFDCYRKDYGKR